MATDRPRLGTSRSQRENQFDNSGNGPIKVPGFGYPIDFEEAPDKHRRFAHGANDWIQHSRLTVRELSMLALMNSITDKNKWNEKLFDKKIVEKWRQEALNKPLISEKAWEWCLKELRDNAHAFEKTGYVPAYDTGSGCIKSDHLVSNELRGELIQAVQPLLDVPAEERDWHPRSGDQVLNLVHPSLFPLVYGKTGVLSKGGQVDLVNILDTCGKGEVALAQQPVHASNNYGEGYIQLGFSDNISNGSEFSDDIRDGSEFSDDIRNESEFSTKFQWLPCEVEFQGHEGNDVKITSYINNLYPSKHQRLYEVIERLISLSIEPWNKVLVFPNENRTPLRIRTYGYTFDITFPDWAKHYLLTRKELGDERFEELLRKTREYLKLPENPDFESNEDDDEQLELDEARKNGSWEQEENLNLHWIVEWKWKRVRITQHPEPGQAFSYEDWKAGEVYNAIIEPPEWKNASFRDHEPYDVDLAKTWRDKGLQVIVKIASIELSPEKPEYEGGNWHIEGMLNEHIIATSIYYYDVDNTTASHIHFRQEAELNWQEFNYPQDEHEPLCEIFGTDALRDNAPAIQELGSVSTPQGRLIAFPNTLQHRVEPFRLQDPTRPGHRRFIVLWLVDPNYRILSTRNVPPQRHDWWAPEGYHKVGIDEKLPAELANMVHEEVGEWPMGLKEAKELRLELMDERTFLMPLVEAHFVNYNFCEH